MNRPRAFRHARALITRLKKLKRARKKSRLAHLKSRGPRRALTPMQRTIVLAKTGGRCHICGGRIKRRDAWAADHILAHAHGGRHDVSNYLPAHGACNGYRRHFETEEFQLVLRLGVWLKTQIVKENPHAMVMAERFVAHDRKLESRRVTLD